MDQDKTIVVRTTRRFKEEIILDISLSACMPFGFAHKEIAICPDGLEATMMGVALGNEGIKVMWYEKHHPTLKGKVCYWGGIHTNLKEAGFKSKPV